MTDDGSLNYRYEARRDSSFTSTSGTSFHEVRLASRAKHQEHFALRLLRHEARLYFASCFASASSKIRLASRHFASLRSAGATETVMASLVQFC